MGGSDHAQLFIMSSMLWTIDPAGENLSAMSNMTNPQGRAKLSRYFPDWDIHRSKSSIYRMAATNIYKTLDGKFFHLHGRLHPPLIGCDGLLIALNLMGRLNEP